MYNTWHRPILKGEKSMKSDEKNQFLNEKQVSELTGIALPTLRNYRCTGKGPAYHKIGRSVRYSMYDIQAFMESCRIKPLNQSME
jgi:predicted DNA-binding transcriptional regulator AlpA